MGLANVKYMICEGDWVLTDEAIQFIDNDNPPLVEFLFLNDEDSWERKVGRARKYCMENYLRETGVHKVVHKVKGNKVSYKEKGKIHWLDSKEILLILRFEHEINLWYSAKKVGKKYRLSDNPHPQYPTSIAKKNAEFLYLSTVKKEQHKIYRVKKSYDTIDELNTPTFGDMPHEENGYRYYALPVNVNKNKVSSLKVYRTRNDYFPYPFLNMPNIYPNFLYQPLDNGTIKVLV
tara:strand:+ start:243 stop:944 length:702 start_codon:yes stop_codon:yes gene_type:complete